MMLRKEVRQTRSQGQWSKCKEKKTEKVTSKTQSSKENLEKISVVYDKGQESFEEEVFTVSDSAKISRSIRTVTFVFKH